jgi:hypothetical protein
MSEQLRFKEQAVRLASIGLISLGLIGCAPDIHTGTRTDLPITDAPSGFPVKTITSGVETFSTGNPSDASIPRSELTDPVGEPLQNSVYPGSVDGMPNPPGMVNVLVSSQEAWVPADEEGHAKDNYTAFK